MMDEGRVNPNPKPKPRVTNYVAMVISIFNG